MKHNLRCIGRIVRVKNGRLVTRRHVYDDGIITVGDTTYKWVEPPINDTKRVIKPRDLERVDFAMYNALPVWLIKQEAKQRYKRLIGRFKQKHANCLTLR